MAGSLLVVTGDSLSVFVPDPLFLWGDVLVLLTGAAWAAYSILSGTVYADFQ